MSLRLTELTWVRRTRVGGEWRDLVDAPLLALVGLDQLVARVAAPVRVCTTERVTKCSVTSHLCAPSKNDAREHIVVDMLRKNGNALQLVRAGAVAVAAVVRGQVRHLQRTL